VWGALCVGAPAVHGQAVGRLEGIVKDQTGIALAGVAVDVHGLTGSVERLILTDSEGGFVVADLPAGRAR